MPNIRGLGGGFAGMRAANIPKGGLSTLGLTMYPNPFLMAGQYEALGITIRSFREPLKRCVQQVVIPGIKNNFDTEGNNVGGWVELAPTTEEQRISQGYDPQYPILQRTKKLYRASQALARWTLTKDKAYVGPDAFATIAPYATVLQNGTSVTNTVRTPATLVAAGLAEDKETTYEDVSLPARPFMMINPKDQPKFDQIFARWFQERGVISGAFYAAGRV